MAPWIWHRTSTTSSGSWPWPPKPAATSRGRGPSGSPPPAPAPPHGAPLRAVPPAPPARAGSGGADRADVDDGGGPLPPVEGDEGSMTRINLRLPDPLKARVEQ